MNQHNQEPNSKPDEHAGMEIERTHESYEKGYPAPGTRDAGKDGKDYGKNTEQQEQPEKVYPKSM